MVNNKIENTGFKKLIGKWKTEGRVLATGKNPEMKITGTDTYEIILDGFFILHKADVLLGNEHSQTFEVIGLGNDNQSAIHEHYNNQGSSGRMTGNLKNGDFTINGDGLRFKGQFSNNDKQLNGTWEKLTDQNRWVEFLHIDLTKVTKHN